MGMQRACPSPSFCRSLHIKLTNTTNPWKPVSAPSLVLLGATAPSSGIYVITSPARCRRFIILSCPNCSQVSRRETFRHLLNARRAPAKTFFNSSNAKQLLSALIAKDGA